MSPIDQQKYRFGKKYNLPESSIDEMFIPFFLAVEQLENKVDALSIENQKLLKKVKTRPIEYQDKSVAFWGNLARYAVPVGSLCLFMLLAYGIFTYQQFQGNKYQNLGRLYEVVTIKDNYYHIDKKHYKTDKTGIYIIETPKTLQVNKTNPKTN